MSFLRCSVCFCNYFDGGRVILAKNGVVWGFDTNLK